MREKAPVFGGIDVAKAQMEVALRPSGQTWSVRRDEGGLARLVKRLQRVQPTLVVLEATEGWKSP